MNASSSRNSRTFSSTEDSQYTVFDGTQLFDAIYRIVLDGVNFDSPKANHQKANFNSTPTFPVICY